MKPTRVGRMIQILTALQSGHNNRVGELAEMYHTSRRTIFRDLERLKEIGIPWYYDAKAGAYSIEPGFFLPSVNLNRMEAMALLLILHKMRNYISMPFKNSILLAAMKLENNLPPRIRQYCNAALRSICIKAEPQAHTDPLDQVFEQLLEAIVRKRIVNMRYYMPREQKSVVIDLSPYHLFYCGIQWYVLGRPSFHKRIRAFRLCRIKELNILDKCLLDEGKFDIQEYLGRAWSMMPEGRLYHVKLRFLPEVPHDVAEVQWHSTQTVTFEDDGSAIVEFRVDGLNEVTWWILSYGDRVQVLAPKILRQRVIEIAQGMVSANQ